MRKSSLVALAIASLLLLSSCSPRDFLTRRLATDLIARSNVFRTATEFQLNTGVVSDRDYLSPGYIALHHRGWISGPVVRCPADIAPPPCHEVALTPSGVETIQALITPAESAKQSFTIPAARRELISITGIAKHGNSADVEFTWKWMPLNEVGAVLYSGDATYRSVTTFRCYDDGWRVVQSSRSIQPLDEALRNAELVR